MSCVRSVRATLLDQPGISEVAVDFQNKTAWVVAEGFFDTDAAIAALADQGYGAELR